MVALMLRIAVSLAGAHASSTCLAISTKEVSIIPLTCNSGIPAKRQTFGRDYAVCLLGRDERLCRRLLQFEVETQDKICLRACWCSIELTDEAFLDREYRVVVEIFCVGVVDLRDERLISNSG